MRALLAVAKKFEGDNLEQVERLYVSPDTVMQSIAVEKLQQLVEAFLKDMAEEGYDKELSIKTFKTVAATEQWSGHNKPIVRYFLTELEKKLGDKI